MTTDQHPSKAVRDDTRHDSPHPHPTSDESARQLLDDGDSKKIDDVLDEVDVSTTKSGKDQSNKPDTEGSTASSKNLDEQND